MTDSVLSLVNRGILKDTVFLILFTALCWAIGRLILLCMRAKENLIISSATFVGLMAMSLQLVAYGILDIPWNRGTLILPYLILSFLVKKQIYTGVRRTLTAFRSTIESSNSKPLIVSGLIFLLLISLAFVLVALPLTGWDALAMWMYKAKIFFLSQSVDYGQYVLDGSRNPDYPPLFSLVIDLLYAFAGGVRESLGKATVFVYLVGFLQMCHTLISTKSRSYRHEAMLIPIIIVLGLATRPFVLSTTYLGYVDFVIGILLSLVMITSWYGFQQRSKKLLLFSVLLSVFAVLHKYDALPSLAISACLYIWVALNSDTQRAKNGLSFVFKNSIPLVLCLLPLLTWVAITKLGDFPSYVDKQDKTISMLISEIPTRSVLIVKYFARGTSTNVGVVSLVPLILIFLYTVIIRIKKYWILAVFLVAQLLIYISVYYITPIDLTTHLRTSVDRLLVQLLIMVLTGVMLILLNESSKKSSKDNS